MIKHVVCLKLADASPENCAKTKELLLTMNDKVPTARKVDVFVDELHSARSFDVMMEVLVDDFATLDVYQNDAYHCDVVKKYLSTAAVQTVVFDFHI